MGYSFLAREQTWAPHWELRVLATGPDHREVLEVKGFLIKAGHSDQISRIAIFSVHWLSRFFAKTGPYPRCCALPYSPSRNAPSLAPLWTPVHFTLAKSYPDPLPGVLLSILTLPVPDSELSRDTDGAKPALPALPCPALPTGWYLSVQRLMYIPRLAGPAKWNIAQPTKWWLPDDLERYPQVCIMESRYVDMLVIRHFCNSLVSIMAEFSVSFLA